MSTTEQSSHSRKRYYVPNTYIVQCHDMLIPEVWAQLGNLDLQFLRYISLGRDSSQYNYLTVFGKEFQDRVNGKLPLPGSSLSSGKTWIETAPMSFAGRGGGRGRGGRGRGGHRVQPPPTPPPTPAPTPTETESVGPPPPLGTDTADQQADSSSTSPKEVIVHVGNKTFTLRPFFVSTDFQNESLDGSSIVPHIVVMYPDAMNTTSAKLRDWLSRALDAFVHAGIIQSDSYNLVTQKLDPSHLKRKDTPNAFIRFKSSVPIESRNAVFSILRTALWFFSLRTDNFDVELIDVNVPAFNVTCRWKINRSSNRRAATSATAPVTANESME